MSSNEMGIFFIAERLAWAAALKKVKLSKLFTKNRDFHAIYSKQMIFSAIFQSKNRKRSSLPLTLINTALYFFCMFLVFQWYF